MTDSGRDGEPVEPTETDYEPPAVLDFGPVFRVTNGSVNNGNADGNGQYYP